MKIGSYLVLSIRFMSCLADLQGSSQDTESFVIILQVLLRSGQGMTNMIFLPAFSSNSFLASGM